MRVSTLTLLVKCLLAVIILSICLTSGIGYARYVATYAWSTLPIFNIALILFVWPLLTFMFGAITLQAIIRW